MKLRSKPTPPKSKAFFFFISRSICNAIFFFFILFFVEETTCFVKHQKFYQFQTNLQDKILSPNNAPVSAPMPIQNTPKLIYSPAVKNRVVEECFTQLGMEQTGVGRKSSDAILNAVADALLVENGGHQLLPGVSDVGGVIIDLQGVSFKISKPHQASSWCWQSSVHEFSYRGGGRLFVLDSARIRVLDCFFLHFNTEGILVQKGHECFLGELQQLVVIEETKDFSGTAIDLASNDNAVTDIAIF